MIATLEDYLPVEARRQTGRPLFILDLSVPRNIDAQIGERPDVYLYSIDDLEAACSHNKELRDKELPKAQKIVEEEATKFCASLDARKSIAAIVKLRDGWNDVKTAEVERLLKKIACDEKTEAEIRYAFDRLVNKLLHSPTVSLRNAAQNDSEAKLAEALKKLFKL